MPRLNSISLLRKARAVLLIDEHQYSFRQASRVVDVPKSTLHENVSKYRSEIINTDNKLSDEYGTKRLVHAVLAQTFHGKSSTRACAETLSILWGTSLSHQTVQHILDLSADIATKFNSEIDLSNVQSAGFDEIFQKSQPILGFVDLESSMISLVVAEDRSGDTWTRFLTVLQTLGLSPKSTVTDGGQGLLKGLSTVFSSSIRIRDLFHVTQKLSKASRAMEGICYRKIAKLERDPEAEQETMELAINIYDRFEKLQCKLRKACHLGDPENFGVYQSAAEVKILIQSCVENLTEFINNVRDHRAIRQARSYLREGSPQITAYKQSIESMVTTQFGELNSKMVLSFLCPLIEYIDLYRRSYDSRARQEFWGRKIAELRSSFRHNPIIDQTEVDAAINNVFQLSTQFQKSNSLIESVNSVVRQHLNTYKSVPRWFCPIFTMFWNHRCVKRGKRKGYSPRELLEENFRGEHWIELILEHFPWNKIRSKLPPVFAVDAIAA